MLTMRPSSTFTPALACLIFLSVVSSVIARDPAGRIDAAKRNPTTDKGATVTPPVKSFDQVDGVQNKRFDRGDLREQRKASVGAKRANIDLQETREKNMISPELKSYDTIKYDQSAYDGQRASRYKTSEQTYRTALSARYQDSLSNAQDAAPKTVIKKRTNFDSVNRFIFRRNRPEGDDLITAAGSAPADSMTTSTKAKR